MSISSLSSESSGRSSLAPSRKNKLFSSGSAISSNLIKISPEYRALRQQLFTLTSTHSSLKLAHERERILFEGQRVRIQEQIQELQEQIDEARKDQVFILNSEEAALQRADSAKSERDQLEVSFKSKISKLERELATEREARHSTDSELTRLKMKLSQESNNNNTSSAAMYDEEFVTTLLAEWKDRAHSLSQKVTLLEEELSLNSRESFINNNSSSSSTEDPEALRQKILSTFVSLEAAQLVLSQRKAEADRLTARIGNIKILEERYREAQIKIKRLETEASCSGMMMSVDNSSGTASPMTSSTSSTASASDLKLIQLTQELGNLRESLALSHLNTTDLQEQLNAANQRLETLQTDLDSANAITQKLQTSLKVKEATIQNLKGQLDSTVTLLTETLKKKKTG